MVLRRRSNTELLSIRSVRQKLVVSMVEPSSASLADSDPDHRIFHRHMDRVPLHILAPIEKPLVGFTRVRHGTWCPTLGTDPLEYLQHGSLSALDGRTDRKWSSRTVTMAVARSTGCSTGRR